MSHWTLSAFSDTAMSQMIICTNKHDNTHNDHDSNPTKGITKNIDTLGKPGQLRVFLLYTQLRWMQTVWSYRPCKSVFINQSVSEIELIVIYSMPPLTSDLEVLC